MKKLHERGALFVLLFLGLASCTSAPETPVSPSPRPPPALTPIMGPVCPVRHAHGVIM